MQGKGEDEGEKEVEEEVEDDEDCNVVLVVEDGEVMRWRPGG